MSESAIVIFFYSNTIASGLKLGIVVITAGVIITSYRSAREMPITNCGGL